MESLLAMLGEAHQSGAFAGDAARYPWRAQAVAAQSRGHRRHSWFWVGAPLAAAAAVAVLFVGPNLFSGSATQLVVQNVPSEFLPVQPELHADNAAAPKATLECDFNGDGKVDGQDIQALVDRSRTVAEDPDAVAELIRDAEQLQRCALEGGS